MSISSDFSSEKQTLTIHVNGRFDFNLHKEFRNAYKDCTAPGTHYVIDLARAEYMDSSALGMLLLLREQVGGDEKTVRIANARPEIRQILTISNFNRLFRID